MNAAGLRRGTSATAQLRESGTFEPRSNGDSAVAGRLGAQHTLARLEREEQEAFARLQTALKAQIDFKSMHARPIG